jgi:2-alkyl-3-oxoalkanoate reductase
MKRKVLVTGYGGFLGQEICRQLLRAGYQVRGLARHRYESIESLGVEVIVGDACCLKDCQQAVVGVAAVIHTAAIAGVWGPAKTYQSINVDATQHLLKAATDAQVQAFVYSSSPSVTFDGQPQKNIDESVPYPTRWLCDYPRTKAQAEQLVLKTNDLGGMMTCALRPHLIWGQGDPHLIPRLINRCRSGRLRRVGDGRNLIDTVHVEAAAAAHALALEALLQRRSEASGRAYFITDGQPVECWSWISDLLQQAGLEPPKASISFKAAYRIGHLLEIIYRTFGIRREPPMTRFVAAQLGVDHYFSIQAAREILHYLPNIDRKAKLSEMSDWLRSPCRHSH